MAQMNAVVGGFAQNVETLGRFRTQAASAGADLVLTPELSLMGYPPEDLLLKEGFIEASRVALIEMALLDNVPPVLVGTVVSEGSGGRRPGALERRTRRRAPGLRRASAPRISPTRWWR